MRKRPRLLCRASGRPELSWSVLHGVAGPITVLADSHAAVVAEATQFRGAGWSGEGEDASAGYSDCLSFFG